MLPTLQGGVCLRGQSGLLSSQPQNSTSSSGGPFCPTHDDQGRCVSAAATIRRPRTGRETSRNNANQREPVINQNGRPEAVSGCLRRSAVWGASIWGTEGREFKSPQPDNNKRRSDGISWVILVPRPSVEVRSGRQQSV